MSHPKTLTWLLMLLAGAHAWAQVATEVPAPVPGAKPVTVDHIRIPGTALEGNLEGNAIALDVGDQDSLRGDTTKLHTRLDEYAIAHSFEVYSGTHTSAVADRFQNHVLPFFSGALSFKRLMAAMAVFRE